MDIQRLPRPALRPFVARVWASDGEAPAAQGMCLREHALPTGWMHLVIRLADSPLRIGAPGEARATPVAHALVGGARSRYYVRELSSPSCSVGAVLWPGAAQCLFDVPACELAEAHTPLEDLWGAQARSLRDRLANTPGAQARLAVLEAALAARLPRLRSLHPAVAAVLGEAAVGGSVAVAVRRSGLSHRRVIELFQRSAGLSPKTYLRVRRFQRALSALRQANPASLAEIALEAGYSDQSHFSREFLSMAGVTPLACRQGGGGEGNHLPVGAGRGQISSIR